MIFQMKKIKKIKIKSYSKSNGKLIPISFKKEFPLKIKRIFLIRGIKNKTRGKHAHKKCSQIFLPIQGKISLKIKTPKQNKKILLNPNENSAIIVPPKYWCEVKFIEKNSVIMVLCDQYYDRNDYIKKFDNYKKYMSK